jgi:uncharacterized membrane protein
MKVKNGKKLAEIEKIQNLHAVMMNRFLLLAENNCRNVADYNKIVKDPNLCLDTIYFNVSTEFNFSHETQIIVARIQELGKATEVFIDTSNSKSKDFIKKYEL